MYENKTIGFLRSTQNPPLRMKVYAAFAKLYNTEIFYFTPDRIDSKKKIIKALFFDPITYSFYEKETTYPYVCDDAPVFSKKHPELYRELSEKSLFTFTPLGGKNSVYNLIKNNGYSRYIIDTFNYTANTDIDLLLEKYNTLILKPNRGNKARNIYKLKKDGEFYNLSILSETEQLTSEEFYDKYFNKFKNQYLIQQYVNSVTTEGNPLNIRAIAFRGRNGVWSLKKYTPRIGPARFFIENLNQGSTLGYASDFLPLEFGDKWEKVASDIAFALKVLPPVIQKGYSTLIDCLGFDIGIDRDNDNSLKIFEVNVYPGSRPFEFEITETKFQYYLYLLENYNRLLSIQNNKTIV